jgi:predicted MFS family arabinose efflux permease
MPWRPALALLGGIGLVMATVILVFTPRYEHGAIGVTEAATTKLPERKPQPSAFPLLLAIGVIDSATRMGFLLFLPFVLESKGASVQIIGLAMTLVFAGGAVGKLACAFIGARIGTIGTVWLTEGSTAVGILALLPLPLEPALVLLPLIGIALNGTSSVLYGSVPDLVAPKSHTRALSIFYTGTIGSGALAPIVYGRIGDALGIWTALTLVAGVVLLTLPIAALLRSAFVRDYGPETA